MPVRRVGPSQVAQAGPWVRLTGARSSPDVLINDSIDSLKNIARNTYATTDSAAYPPVTTNAILVSLRKYTEVTL